MDKREMVGKALRHQEQEVVPFQVGFTQQAAERFLQWTGDPDSVRRFQNEQNYICGFQYDGSPTELPDRPGYFRDDFGVVWNRTGADKDIGVIEGTVIGEIDGWEYSFPPIDKEKLKKRIAEVIEHRNGQFVNVGIGFSLFERAWSLCSMEEVLMAMLTAPKSLSRLFDAICDYNLELLEVILSFDVDSVYFGDDWGQQKGLIMGAPLWRQFIKPPLKRMYEFVKQKNRFVVQHSCGDIHEIFPDLIEIGLDCYQTFQPEIYPMETIKKEYGAHLCFWGGISTQRLLPFASAEEVRRVTAETLRIMKPSGGYIAGPTHAIPGDVPPENIQAMMEVLTQQTPCAPVK